MVMKLEDYRAKNTLALRNWRHRNRERYRAYQRDYKRRYFQRMREEYVERTGMQAATGISIRGGDYEQVAKGHD